MMSFVLGEKLRGYQSVISDSTSSDTSLSAESLSLRDPDHTFSLFRLWCSVGILSMENWAGTNSLSTTRLVIKQKVSTFVLGFTFSLSITGFYLSAVPDLVRFLKWVFLLFCLLLWHQFCPCQLPFSSSSMSLITFHLYYLHFFTALFCQQKLHPRLSYSQSCTF